MFFFFFESKDVSHSGLNTRHGANHSRPARKTSLKSIFRFVLRTVTAVRTGSDGSLPFFLDVRRSPKGGHGEEKKWKEVATNVAAPLASAKALTFPVGPFEGITGAQLRWDSTGMLRFGGLSTACSGGGLHADFWGTAEEECIFDGYADGDEDQHFKNSAAGSVDKSLLLQPAALDIPEVITQGQMISELISFLVIQAISLLSSPCYRRVWGLRLGLSKRPLRAKGFVIAEASNSEAARKSAAKGRWGTWWRWWHVDRHKGAV
jgi:hypothetical protein